MEKIIQNVVEEYQCLGCVVGSDTSCYEKGGGVECAKHVAGTRVVPYVGLIFLGMPTGFNRLGGYQEMGIRIFQEFGDGWGYCKFNRPVWKYLDEHGNTLVRGLSPRINQPFLHIFLGDQRDKIDCVEITAQDIAEMD